MPDLLLLLALVVIIAVGRFAPALFFWWALRRNKPGMTWGFSRLNAKENEARDE